EFIACHQFEFIQKLDMVEQAAHGATVLINSPYDNEQTWDHLPQEVQKIIIEQQLKLYIINAVTIARKARLNNSLNTVM
ncbi:hypothetical protein, partial [Poseidonibacter lekithochrous]|uniref:hypothetical protein n=1 Tax=Poseidonibacter lekithochrous TaxID=1904463 RepID=UPI000ADA0AE9